MKASSLTPPFFGGHLAAPISPNRRPDQCCRCICQIYPPVPFPVPIGHRLLLSPPEAVRFRAEFRPVVSAIAIADHTDSFTMPLCTDLDHRPGQENLRSPGPTQGHHRCWRDSSQANFSCRLGRCHCRRVSRLQLHRSWPLPPSAMPEVHSGAAIMLGLIGWAGWTWSQIVQPKLNM